jgi:D-cysteine desulfhydrase
MPRLTAFVGGPKIWFKRDDLTGSALAGNKIRKLEFSLAQALDLQAKVIITAGGIQSNHCRATAFACAQLGLKCHLILRGGPGDTAADGNLLLDHLAGAEITFVPHEQYSTSRPEILAGIQNDYESMGLTSYWIPVGASNAIGSFGYIRAFDEMMAQIVQDNLNIRHVVTAVGSGGTLAGLIAGRACTSHATPPKLWGVNVCNDAPFFEEEIRGILHELKESYKVPVNAQTEEVNIIDGYVGEGYAIPYAAEMETIRQVGQVEGQVLDPVYTGKAFHALIEECKAGRFTPDEDVVFIHTGGIYGLFPARDQLGF